MSTVSNQFSFCPGVLDDRTEYRVYYEDQSDFEVSKRPHSSMVDDIVRLWGVSATSRLDSTSSPGVFAYLPLQYLVVDSLYASLLPKAIFLTSSLCTIVLASSQLYLPMQTSPCVD